MHCTVQDADLYGHGSHAPTYVPVFGSVLPTQMVRFCCKQLILYAQLDWASSDLHLCFSDQRNVAMHSW